MTKAFFAAGFAVAMTLGAAAQSKKKEPPPPPAPPPPQVEAVAFPPPPPPQPPALREEEKASLPKDYQDFLKRNPSVKSVYWSKNTLIISLKQGGEERYTSDEKGLREAEAKYGKLPQAPPPPPAPPIPPKPPRAPKPKQ